MFVLATNGWDVLVFGIPSTIAAFGGLLAAFWSHGAKGNARAAKEQVQSPNGTTTGEAVHQLQVEVREIKKTQGEFRESVHASRVLTTEMQEQIQAAKNELAEQIGELKTMHENHADDDERRFSSIDEQLTRMEDA